MVRVAKTGSKASKAKTRRANQAKGRKSGTISPSNKRRWNAGRETEVARLKRELKEALARQTATSEVLAVINASPGDLTPVFEVILAKAHAVCGADQGGLFLWDGTHSRAVATLNYPDDVDDMLRQPRLPNPAQIRLLAGERYNHVHDLLTVPDVWVAGFRERSGIRTNLRVPLRKDGASLGFITANRREVRPYSDSEIALLENFAAQAVIAIENARLFSELQARTTELSEALESQTATSEVLKVISRSPDVLQPVLDAIVRISRKLCGSDSSTINLLREDALHAVAIDGARAGRHNTPGEYRKLDEKGSAAARALRERRTLHVPDTTKDHEYGQGGPISTGPARGILSVPLMSGGEAVGTLTLSQTLAKPFTARMIETVETFADQAVIAISNVNLFEQVQQRTRELTESLQFQTATSDVLKVIGRSPDTLQPVLDVIVNTSQQLCGSETSTFFLLRDGMFHLAASVGDIARFLNVLKTNPLTIDQKGSVIALAVREKRTVHVPNTTEDPGSADYSFAVDRPRALLAVPLIHNDQVLGCITMRQSHMAPFTARQIEAIETFADQALIAISNVTLFEQVQQRTRELSKSLDDLRTAQDRLVQTEKLASLGQLTAGIAHEIKNPLNFVNNFSALSAELIDEMKDILSNISIENNRREELDDITRMLKGNLEKVVQHGKRADSIVKNMLLHSRQGSGEHRPVDINALIDESLNLAYHGARAEQTGFNIDMKRNFDPAVGMADVYPQEITRVLLNLISNGFYATAKRKTETGDGFEPTLSVASKNLGDKVEIRIRDNGTGIPAEAKEKIFNPFFTTKPAGEGTGLGLSMSHDIVVKQHGGTIEVDTEPGAFTEFRIVLPRDGANVIQPGEQR